MAAEAAEAVMVLAVDVVGDGTAQADPAGARHHGWEPSRAVLLRAADAGQDFRELDTGLRLEQARGGIEVDEAVKPSGVEEEAIGVEAGITVGTATTVSQSRHGGS